MSYWEARGVAAQLSCSRPYRSWRCMSGVSSTARRLGGTRSCFPSGVTSRERWYMAIMSECLVSRSEACMSA